MNASVGDAISNALGAAQSCSEDAECTLVATTTACGGTCGAPVNTGGKAAVEAVVSWVSDNICTANDYGASCGYSEPGCVGPNPGCVDGTCVYAKPLPPEGCPTGTFAPYNSPECLGATCENMSTSVNGAIDAAVAAAKACTKDKQCVIVQTSTACQGTCGVAVNKDDKSGVKDVVEWVSENICEENDFASMCGYATPSCLAPNPGCEAGACVYIKVSDKDL